MCRCINLQIPLRANSLVYLSGFALSVSPGHVAELAKVIFLKPFGVTPSAALSLIFNDRFLDFTCAVIFCSALLFIFPNLYWALGVLVAVVVFIFVLVKISSRVNPFLKLVSFINHLKEIQSLRSTAPNLLLSLLSWGLQGIILYTIANKFIELPLLAALGIYMAGLALGALSMIPGGLGAAEVSIAGLLVAMGFDIKTAAYITMITRAFTFWPAVILGVISLSLYSFNINKYIVTGNKL